MSLSEKDRDHLLNYLSYMSHQQWIAYAQRVCKLVDEETREEWKKHFLPYEKLQEKYKLEHLLFAERTLKLIEPTILKRTFEYEYIKSLPMRYLR